MRFLVHEQNYETLIASGEYRFYEDDKPTGAKETWRLTAAVEGYRILRVDLDARDAASGDSFLFHLVLNQFDTPERLLFRFWGGNGQQIEGNLLVEKQALTVTRDVDGTRFEDELDIHTLSVPWVFWFPSVAGLGLLAETARNNRAVSGVTLNHDDEFKLEQMTVTCDTSFDEILSINDKPFRTLPVTLSWRDAKRIVWLDEHNLPLKMAQDGLVAIEHRYVRHRDA